MADVVITAELLTRPTRAPNARAEFAALHSLAYAASLGAYGALKRLASLAVELCEAGSGGISVIETGETGAPLFRWQALAGRLESFEGGSTPREWSPCGECLRTGKPALYSRPSRYFTYFQDVDIPIEEGLVIPMYGDKLAVGTIWVISHNRKDRFNAEDVRVMTGLGNFAAAVLHIASGREHSAAVHSTTVEREWVWNEYLCRIARKDHDALAALIEETQPFVFTTALRILSFRADAEEVAADVYARIWKAAPAYNPNRGSVRAWLACIARRQAIDYLRCRRHRTPSAEALWSECSAANPEDGAATTEMRGLLVKALATLPKLQEEAISLAYFSELTLPEIAVRLRQPLGSVKTRIRLGLMKLRLRLAALA